MSAQLKSRKYLESQIKTASKEQLLIMLYDGAIQNCTQAQEYLDLENFEAACEKLIKAQNIVAELISSLHFDKNQAVSKNLASLYSYVYIQLMDANIKHNSTAIQNSLKILTSLKNTWLEAFEKIGFNSNVKSTEEKLQIENTSSQSKPLGISIQA